MKDLLIVYEKSEKKLAEELNMELRLLGVRAFSQSIENSEEIGSALSNEIKNYSSILVFITENLSKNIIEGKIEIKNSNNKIILMSYGLKQKLTDQLSKKLKCLTISKSRVLHQFSLEVIREMADTKRKIKLTHSNRFEDIWDSPLSIYKKMNGLRKSRHIVLDVAWSAGPTKPEPAPALINALNKTFKYINKEPYDILDFGAGKLRHTVMILEMCFDPFWFGFNLE